jgi:hypothetical protein
MRGGWKIAVALLLLAAIAALIWGRQDAPHKDKSQSAPPRAVKPDGSTRPDRERPGREREQRPGSASK